LAPPAVTVRSAAAAAMIMGVVPRAATPHSASAAAVIWDVIWDVIWNRKAMSASTGSQGVHLRF
jgi:hypothetical protein